MKNIKKIFGIGAAFLIVIVAVIPAINASEENKYIYGMKKDQRHRLREPGIIMKFLIKIYDILPFLKFNATIGQKLNLTLDQILLPK